MIPLIYVHSCTAEYNEYGNDDYYGNKTEAFRVELLLLHLN